MAAIVLNGITKQFPDGTTAVRVAATCDVGDGELHGAGRPVRMRQVDDAADDRRASRN